MQVKSVNVTRAVPMQIDGRSVLSAIGKQPVQGPVEVGALGLAGDEQAELAVHGGLDKAIYAYPTSHYAFWQTVRAQARVAAVG
jgi:MOSC domain-containing protein YiiM